MPEHETSDPYAPAMSRSLFEVRGRTYTLGQVFSAAAFGGWIGGFWKDLEDGLASAGYAEDEGFTLDTAVLQSAADQFRYDRNLVTAEETERWLSDRDVDEDDLIGFLERRYWLERFRGTGVTIPGDYAPAPAAAADALWPEVVLSGRLAALAVPLARRVAAAASAGIDEPDPDVRRAFFQRTGCAPGGLAAWLERNRCTMDWFRELLSLETVYLRCRSEALSPARCSAALESRRLDLVRIGLRSASFPSERHAREAHLCITDDGEEFADAVRRAGAAVEARTMLLEDAPEPLRGLLLSAAPAEIVRGTGPRGEPLLVQVLSKTPPGVDDPEVRSRLEPALLSRYFDPLVEADVRWTVALEPSP